MSNNSYRNTKVAGIILASLGVFFIALGAIFYLAFKTTAPDSIVGFYVFGGLGLLLIIPALICFYIYVNGKKKVERLTTGGDKYTGSITNMRYDNLYSSYRYRSPVIVECSYKNKDGNVYLVKSKPIWDVIIPSNLADLETTVYVNPSNPKDYYVSVNNKHYASDTDANVDLR